MTSDEKSEWKDIEIVIFEVVETEVAVIPMSEHRTKLIQEELEKDLDYKVYRNESD
jgi:hypothetical protein